MTQWEKQQAILQHLGVVQWRVKQRSKNDSELLSEEPILNGNKLCIISSLSLKKTTIESFVNAMFSRQEVCYADINDLTLEQIVASSATILYDKTLNVTSLLDGVPYAKSFAIDFDKLDCADVKKQTMMSIYAVSDFAPK